MAPALREQPDHPRGGHATTAVVIHEGETDNGGIGGCTVAGLRSGTRGRNGGK